MLAVPPVIEQALRSPQPPPHACSSKYRTAPHRRGDTFVGVPLCSIASEGSPVNHNSIVGKVAPQQKSAATEPDWPFRPAHSAGKVFDCRIENPVFGKARIERFDGRIGISLGWLPARWSLFFGPVPLRRGHVQITPGLRVCYYV